MMTPFFRSHLPHRGIIRVAGTDRHPFLQALVSNDISNVTSTVAVYAALLTPQGKFLHDLFILEYEDSFLIDCDAERADDLIQRLTTYKLRSKVSIEKKTDVWDVWAISQGDIPPSLSYKDPRLSALGFRSLSLKGAVDPHATDFTAYDTHRLMLGIGDGCRDLDIEKSSLAEGNFDFLHGIDWKKGCYVGQELTARMHYRGLAKKRLFPVHIEGAPPPRGALLDQETGEMRSSCGAVGLALLKIETAQQAWDQNSPLIYQGTKLWPTLPSWMKIDATPLNR